MSTITKHFWIKPAVENQPVKFDGVGDNPGITNYGSASNPVILSAGAYNEWTNERNLASDPSDTKTYEYIFHFTTPEKYTAYPVGPAFLPGTNTYIQGDESLCYRVNPKRPNRKVRIVFLTEGTGKVGIKSSARAWTKELTDRLGGEIEHATVMMQGPGVESQVEYFKMHDFVINANFNNQGYFATQGAITHGHRIHCVAIRATNIDIEDCTFINAGGTNDTKNNTLAKEVFPFGLYSVQPAGLATETRVRVHNCKASSAWLYNGAYATYFGINVFTDKPEPKPVDFDFEPSVYWAEITNFTVDAEQGTNGCGCSGTTDGKYASCYIAFRHGTIHGATFGVNMDTGSARYILYEDIKCIACNSIAQQGSATGGITGDGKPDPMNPPFHHNIIYRNIRHYPHRHRVPVTNLDYVRFCGFHIRNNALITLDDVLIILPHPEDTCAWTTNPTLGDLKFYPVFLSSAEPYKPIATYYGSAGAANTVVNDWAHGAGAGIIVMDISTTVPSTQPVSCIDKAGRITT